MVLRWHGGDHTVLKLRVKLNASGKSYNPVTDDLVALVRELARLMPDRQIARLLNRTGTQMATGKAWTEQSVHGFRKHRDIAPYREGRRNYAGGCRQDHRRLQYDRAAHAPSRRHQGTTGLPRRSLGN